MELAQHHTECHRKLAHSARVGARAGNEIASAECVRHTYYCSIAAMRRTNFIVAPICVLIFVNQIYLILPF